MLEGSVRGARILLIDDEPQFLSIMKYVVESLDGIPELAGTVIQVIARIEEPNDSIDIVVSDINLAGESGFAIVERARELPRHIPVILVTGNDYLGNEDAIDYRVLRKPFSLKSFAELLVETAQEIHK